MNQSARPDGSSVPGIIESLSSGFQTINRVPWIIGVPIVIDLVVWLGPRLSIAELTTRVFDRFRQVVGRMGQAAGPSGDQQVEQFEQQIELLTSAVQTFNLLSLVAVGGFISSAVPPERSGIAGTVEIGSVAGVLVLGLILSMVGLAIACGWLGAMAQQVRDGTIEPWRVLYMTPRYWLRIVGFFLLAIGVLVGIALPLSAAAAVTQAFVPFVGGVLAIFTAVVIQLLVVWALIFLFFFVDAIVVSEVGPLRAATFSIRIVSANFWSAIGFIIITWVIMGGTGVIWGSLARNPIGMATAILGNSYVGSGLAAASMLFYRSRVARLLAPPDPRVGNPPGTPGAAG